MRWNLSFRSYWMLCTVPSLLIFPVRKNLTYEFLLSLKELGQRRRGGAFQEEDDAWQAEVRGLLLEGMALAKQIVSLKIEAGEGAVLQKFIHHVRTVFQGCDYRQLSASSTELIGDAKEYQRTVKRFCSRVRNGWSDRTKKQAAYFRGLCQRVEEMANHSKTIIEHKAGINRLIGLELKRVRQEFYRSYDTFINLSYVIMDPTRINTSVNETLALQGFHPSPLKSRAPSEGDSRSAKGTSRVG